MTTLNSSKIIVTKSNIFKSDLAILSYLSLLKFIVHLLVNGQYGYFRDELSYIEDTKHLDWGFVDHPPLAPFLGSISRFLFEDSLVGFRVFPALFAAATLFVTGLIVRELGGSQRAQIIGVVCLAMSPVNQIFGVIFQAADFEQLFWAIVCLLIVRMIRTNNPKLWLWVGVVIGLSAMNKYSVAFFVVGLGLAVLLTPVRKHLLTPWPWLGIALAGLIFMPNLVWLMQHNFISLDYTRSVNARDVSIGRADGFLPQQFFQVLNPVTVPIWLMGLYYLLFKEKQYRVLGFTYLFVLVELLVLQGRWYYLAPAYPVILAAGSVWLDRWLSQGSKWKFAYITLLPISLLITLPLGLPVLPAGSDAFRTVIKINDTYVEMFGWQELTGQVNRIYQGLTPQERNSTAILANNYGEAGAINLYGPAYSLPQAISPVNSYYYWSMARLKADNYIILGFTKKQAEAFQGQCQQFEEVASRVSNVFNVKNEETNYQIYLCRNLKTPLPTLWPGLQRFS